MNRLSARWVLLPEHDPWGALDRHVAALSKTRSVLVVSARRPLEMAKDALAEAGADLSHVLILDVASDAISARIKDPEHEASVPNAGHMELIIAKAMKIVKAKAERAASIILDDSATFVRHNGADAYLEAVRHARHLGRPGDEQEYVVPPSLDKAHWAAIRDGLDASAPIDGAGNLRAMPRPGEVILWTGPAPSPNRGRSGLRA